MESTGWYSDSIARYLRDSGIFVSIVNAVLIYNYGGNTTVRVNVKTDERCGKSRKLSALPSA